jgi:hypothetical protein
MEDREQEVEGRGQKQREIRGDYDLLPVLVDLLGRSHVRRGVSLSLATLDHGKAKV